jgi:hypothetical protein
MKIKDFIKIIHLDRCSDNCYFTFIVSSKDSYNSDKTQKFCYIYNTEEYNGIFYLQFQPDFNNESYEFNYDLLKIFNNLDKNLQIKFDYAIDRDKIRNVEFIKIEKKDNNIICYFE